MENKTMTNILTLTDQNERSGRSYTFEFEDLNNKSVIMEMMLNTDNKLLIQMIKREKLAKTIDYKILGVDDATDTLAFSFDNDVLKIPLIERVYSPKGLALPGGFVEQNDTRQETSIKEFHEELGYLITSNPLSETKIYAGKDEDGNLYDSRGQVTTQCFLYEIPSNVEFKAGTDARKHIAIEINLSNTSIDDIKNKIDQEINKLTFAMPRHKELILDLTQSMTDRILEIKSIDNNIDR